MRKLLVQLGGLLATIALAMFVGCSKAPPAPAAASGAKGDAHSHDHKDGDHDHKHDDKAGPEKSITPPTLNPAANIPEKGAKD